MTKTIIIVAGGSGSRMGADTPKQFISIKGKPLLMHTIEKFYGYDPSMSIILTLPTTEIDNWKGFCIKHKFVIEHEIVEGGRTRFHSVLNAIKTIKNTDIIAVHDGVRPFVSHKVLDNCFKAMENHEAVIPVIFPVDSMRKVEGEKNYSVYRENFRIVQTPQVFRSQTLIEAYGQEYNKEFTDDASVVENHGKEIYLVEGNRENIKITTPFDLILANALVEN